MKLTDQLKEAMTALTLCYGYEPVKALPIFIHHPLFESNRAAELKPNGEVAWTILAPENIDEVSRARLERIFHDYDEVEKIFLAEFIRAPYQLDYLYHLADLLEPKTFARLLGFAFKRCEFPHQSGVRRLTGMWKRISPLDRSEVMDEYEYQRYQEMQDADALRVYRGVRPGKATIRGLSWTMNPSIAKWFANRFHGQEAGGEVYVATLKNPMKNLFAYYESEEEVVINPSALSGVDRIDQTKIPDWRLR